jgi:hypothetical protein
MPRQGFRTVNQHATPARQTNGCCVRHPSERAMRFVAVGADQSLFMFARPFFSVSHIGVASSWLMNCGFGCSVSSSVQKMSNDHC